MPLKLEVDLSKLTPELRRRLLSVLDDCAEQCKERFDPVNYVFAKASTAEEIKRNFKLDSFSS